MCRQSSEVNLDKITMSTQNVKFIKTMILTYDNLHALGSLNGVGWNKKQLACIGVSWPASKGWLQNLIGTEIDTCKYEMAMSLRKDRQIAYKSKETAQHSNPKPMTEGQIKALCIRMDKKIHKMKRDEKSKRRQQLLSQKHNRIDLPKMYKRVHRAKDWYGF